MEQIANPRTASAVRGSFPFRSTDRNIFLPASLDEATDRKATGTVVYIHPEGRYYTVEFDLGFYKFRECYNT